MFSNLFEVVEYQLPKEYSIQERYNQEKEYLFTLLKDYGKVNILEKYNRVLCFVIVDKDNLNSGDVSDFENQLCLLLSRVLITIRKSISMQTEDVVQDVIRKISSILLSCTIEDKKYWLIQMDALTLLLDDMGMFDCNRENNQNGILVEDVVTRLPITYIISIYNQAIKPNESMLCLNPKIN